MAKVTFLVVLALLMQISNSAIAEPVSSTTNELIKLTSYQLRCVYSGGGNRAVDETPDCLDSSGKNKGPAFVRDFVQLGVRVGTYRSSELQPGENSLKDLYESQAQVLNYTLPRIDDTYRRCKKETSATGSRRVCKDIPFSIPAMSPNDFVLTKIVQYKRSAAVTWDVLVYTDKAQQAECRLLRYKTDETFSVPFDKTPGIHTWPVLSTHGLSYCPN